MSVISIPDKFLEWPRNGLLLAPPTVIVLVLYETDLQARLRVIDMLTLNIPG